MSDPGSTPPPAAEPSNAQAFIEAADAIVTAAPKFSAGSQTPEERADQIAGLLNALSAQNGSGWLAGTLQAMQEASSAAVTSNTVAGGDPSVTCTDGTVISIPAPEVGGLNKVTDTSTDFFPTGPGASIFKFIFNALADVAAGFAIFGQIGAIQSRELINGFNAVRPTATISPEVAADMAERNILSDEVAQNEALAGGIGADRFSALRHAAGEPPGIVEMLSLLRRGLIGEDDFKTAVAESRIYTKYICDLLLLAHETMSGADAIESYIKGVPIQPGDFTAEGLTPPAGADELQLRDEFFAAMFRRAGGLPSQWNILKEGAGDAIGVQRAAALHGHGLITEAQFIQIINRSRINPIFNYAAELGNAKWFASFQVGKMLSTGGATAAQGTQWLLEDGYPADQVAAFVAAYAGEKTLKARQETEAQLAVAYESGLISQADFETGLKALGYHQASLPAIEQTITARRKLQAELSAVSHIRAQYLAGHISLTQVHSGLMQLGIQAPVIKDYLKIWPIEQATQAKSITSSMLGSLVRKNRVGKAEAIARWEKMGYSAEDASLMYREYEPTVGSVKSAVPYGDPLP